MCGDERVSHLALLSIERELTLKLDYDVMIDTFAKKGNRASQFIK